MLLNILFLRCKTEALNFPSSFEMFCSSNDTIQNLAEKTKLLAQKCSQQIRVVPDQSSVSTNDVSVQQVATFKSYIVSSEYGDGQKSHDFPPDTKSRINCLTVNISSLNRLIRNRCSFVSTTPFPSNTLPKRKIKKATSKWYIKVSLSAVYEYLGFIIFDCWSNYKQLNFAVQKIIKLRLRNCKKKVFFLVTTIELS